MKDKEYLTFCVTLGISNVWFATSLGLEWPNIAAAWGIGLLWLFFAIIIYLNEGKQK